MHGSFQDQKQYLKFWTQFIFDIYGLCNCSRSVLIHFTNTWWVELNLLKLMKELFNVYLKISQLEV